MPRPVAALQGACQTGVYNARVSNAGMRCVTSYVVGGRMLATSAGEV